MYADQELPQRSAESVSADAEDLRNEAGKANFLRNGEQERQREIPVSKSPVSISEEEEAKIRASNDVTLIWCIRCDTNLIFVHGSLYCPNCKYKVGCCEG